MGSSSHKQDSTELWLVENCGTFHQIYASFGKPLVVSRYPHPLAFGPWQIDDFCEHNPEILKKYYQGTYFLMRVPGTHDLEVAKIMYDSVANGYHTTTHPITYGGGVLERNKGIKKELHCFILPASWRE